MRGFGYALRASTFRESTCNDVTARQECGEELTVLTQKSNLLRVKLATC